MRHVFSIVLLFLILAEPGVQAQYAYRVNADNTLTITGYTGPGGIVTIPSYINDMLVTIIGDGAFSTFLDNTTPSSLIIPDGIVSIGGDVFDETRGLTNLTIGAGVTNISDQAFVGFASLTSIVVSTLNSNYSSVDGVLFDKNQDRLIQFPGGRTGPYVVPLSVTSLGNSSFEFSPYLTNITIPAGVTNIGDAAFYYCFSLTGVYFYGDAPISGSNLFDTGNPTTAYYLPGTIGWNSKFDYARTALWTPLIAGIGLQSDIFGFSVSWATNHVVVVETSVDLAHLLWTPVETNSFSNGAFMFRDPNWTNYAQRFYRVISQ